MSRDRGFTEFRVGSDGHDESALRKDSVDRHPRREQKRELETLKHAAGEVGHAPPKPSPLPWLNEEDATPVVLAMLEGTATRITTSEHALKALKQHQDPLVRTAVWRDGQKVATVGEWIGMPSLSKPQERGPRSSTGPLDIERELRSVGEARTAEQQRLEVARATRWWWLSLGWRLQLTDSRQAEAAHVSKANVQKIRSSPEGTVQRYRAVLRQRMGALLQDANEEMQRTAARVMLELAVEDAGTDSGALHHVAYLALLEGEDALGLAEYERATAMGNACSANNLGYYHWKTGNQVEAVRWYRRAEAMEHRCAPAVNFGRCLEEADDLEQAEQAFRRAAELGVVGAHTVVAQFLCRHDRHDEELPFWEAAAAAEEPTGLANMAHRAWQAGEHARAEALSRRAADLGWAASAHWLSHRTSNSRERLELLIRASDGGDRDATNHLIAEWCETDPARALNACLRLESQGGKPPPALFAVLLEQVDGSEKAVRRAAELWLESGGATGSWSAARLHKDRLGRKDIAHDLYGKALELALDEEEHDLAVGCLIELVGMRTRPDTGLVESLQELVDPLLTAGHEALVLALSEMLERSDQPVHALRLLGELRRRVRSKGILDDIDAETMYLRASVAEARDSDISREISAESIRVFKRAARRGSTRGLIYLGAVLSGNEDPYGAAECYRELVDRDQPYARELGRELALADDFEGAIEALEAGLEAGQEDCRHERAMLENDVDAALAIWGTTTIPDSSDAIAAAHRVSTLGRHREALAILKPHSGCCALSAKGSAYSRMGQHGKAGKLFRESAAVGCSHGNYNLILHGVIHGQRVSKLEIQQAFNRLIEADQADLDVALLLAEFTKDDPAGPTLLPAIHLDRGDSPEVAALLKRESPRTTPRFRKRVADWLYPDREKA